jgi:ABC-2 type transport system permease protein
MIWTLIKYRLKMFISFNKGGKSLGKALLITFALLAASIGIFGFSYGIYEFAKIDPVAGVTVLHNLMAGSFHGMLMLLFIWGLSMAVLSIFFSNDLDLLLTLPIKPRDVFIYKVGEATFLNIRMSILLLIPSLVIYGIYYHASIPYYLIAILITILLAIVPGMLGIVVATYLSKRVPRARLKGILTFVGSLVGIAIWAGINQFSGRYSSNSADFGSSFMKTSHFLSSPAFNYLPSGWAYNATVNAASGNWGVSLEFLLILAALAFILSYPALKLTAGYYAGGIADEIAAPVAKASSANIEISGSPLKAHIKRDLILFRRESGVIMQGVMMLIFLLLYPFILSQKDSPFLTLLPISIFSAVFAAMFGGQISSRLIPLEKLAFWQNLVIPNGRSLTLASKLIVGLIFVTTCSTLVAIIHIYAGRAYGISAIFLTISFAWAGFAVGLPLGAFFGNFNWEHPKRMLSGGGGFIFIFGTMVTAAILYFVVYLINKFLGNFINPAVVSFLVSVTLLFVSAVIANVKLANMEWTPNV